MSTAEIIPANQILPNKIHILPILNKPFYPGIFSPIMLFNERDIETAQYALSTDTFIGLQLVKNDDLEFNNSENLFSVGTVAKIAKKINLPDGGINVLISTISRYKVKKYINQEHPITAAVQYLNDFNYESDEVKALTRALITEMKQVSENNPLFSEEMRLNMVNIDHPGKIADFIASILNVERLEQQKVLETLDVKKRLEQVLLYIKKEQELLRIQKKIQSQINEKITKSQREYFLKEELKLIKSELGMPVDARSQEYNQFKEQVEKLNLKGEPKELINSELEKFALMDPNSSEYVVTRNYIETVVNLPWNKPELQEINMPRAQKILNEDHYGLEDIKERILEHLAVRKLKKDTKGSIICLVGPPGVGKTSVGKSIARAMNKKFFRFSVGGMRDEAEIKGHRKTYVGAMPGKIIQGLKIVKTADPVFMIDEIDKLGVSYQGDPSSALLEVLDPEQNVEFRDHYLNLPFDISNVLFITTANTLDTIPRPLLDRMEVIHLSGYINQEKIAIARKYLIPKSLDKSGLQKSDVKYDNGALLQIAEGYAREAGLRNYEKALDKIHRKMARLNVMNEITFPVNMKKESLEKYLKKPDFDEEEIKKVKKPGMAIGLAWTSLGGATLTIEAIANKGKEGFKLTGQMGDVMQESANIAYSYVRQTSENFGVSKEYFENHLIHVHIPAGATPKDGPSAGITMATCLLSLIRNKKIKSDLAMTGELSLAGFVLPIGGLKEKTIAAKRNKIRTIIIPYQNLKDLDEIPEKIKSGITFYPVKTMEEVIEKAF